jgi:hypothetical protein
VGELPVEAIDGDDERKLEALEVVDGRIALVEAPTVDDDQRALEAALARLETEVAVGTLVRDFPNLAPKMDEYAGIPSIALRGVQALPVTL